MLLAFRNGNVTVVANLGSTPIALPDGIVIAASGPWPGASFLSTPLSGSHGTEAAGSHGPSARRGDDVVSIDEVARHAGVSTATVSRALSGRGHVSDPTRARVEAAAKALGYVVSASASSLASGRTRNIGVLVPFLDRWFFSTVLSGIARR